MASSSCPIMNNVNIHDISFNEEVLSTSTILYDNSNIDNVQVAYKGGELEIPKVNVERLGDTYVTKMCLEILCKQRLLWRPHY
jgi:hypothetical protein